MMGDPAFGVHVFLVCGNPYNSCKISLKPRNTQSKSKGLVEPFGVNAWFWCFLKDNTLKVFPSISIMYFF